MSDVTRILNAIEHGDPAAADQLLPLVYGELRKLAASRMAAESSGHTLQPTALVHEAWLRLVGDKNPEFDGRGHFFAAASEAMRRILIDRARRKKALRHGGGFERVELTEADVASRKDDDELIAVNEALENLAGQNKMEAELVKLRYFVGMTNAEAAAVLGITEAVAKHYWIHARAWLYLEITSQQTKPAD